MVAIYQVAISIRQTRCVHPPGSLSGLVGYGYPTILIMIHKANFKINKFCFIFKAILIRIFFSVKTSSSLFYETTSFKFQDK